MTSDWWKNTHGALLDDAMPPTLSKGKWDKLGDNIESIKSLTDTARAEEGPLFKLIKWEADSDQQL
uniref:Uncharacterized protein n=1 Tax=Gibberella zeae TaxID=5518 RepID=A0A4E9DT15_GIBZA